MMISLPFPHHVSPDLPATSPSPLPSLLPPIFFHLVLGLHFFLIYLRDYDIITQSLPSLSSLQSSHIPLPAPSADSWILFSLIIIARMQANVCTCMHRHKHGHTDRHTDRYTHKYMHTPKHNLLSLFTVIFHARFQG